MASPKAPKSTRETEWQKIARKHRKPDRRLAAWSATDVLAKISDEEWAAAHAGKCDRCGEPARFYVQGWACPEHAPGQEAK